MNQEDAQRVTDGFRRNHTSAATKARGIYTVEQLNKAEFHINQLSWKEITDRINRVGKKRKLIPRKF